MRCRRKGSFIGWLAVILGAVILSLLVLPRWFWWFLAGAALLAGGIVLLKR